MQAQPMFLPVCPPNHSSVQLAPDAECTLDAGATQRHTDWEE